MPRNQDDWDIDLTGGKNLTRMSYGGKRFMRRALRYAHRRIRANARRGLTGDGRPMPAYSAKYRRALARQGKRLVVDLEDTGQMWANVAYKINNKGQGSVAFKGGRRRTVTEVGADGTTQTVRKKETTTRKRKDGTTQTRNLTNQMLASILSFREPGKPRPDRPLNFVPRGRFMDIGKKDGDHLTRMYRRHHMRQIAGLPPALP